MQGIHRWRAIAWAVAAALCLAVSACSVAAPPDRGPGVESGQPFDLRPGEQVHTADGRWRLGFEAVSQDSRCPRGVQCVWAGDATVRLWLQPRAGARTALALRAAPGAGQSAVVQGLELRLLQLSPYPSAGRSPAPGDYVASLSWRPSAAADSRPTTPEATER